MPLTEEEIQALQEQNEKLSKRLEKMEDSDVLKERLSDLISDPDIRAIMDAKENGEIVKVRIGDPDDPGSKPLKMTDRDVDEMTNSELFHHMSNTFSEKIGIILEEKMTPVSTRLQDLDNKEENERAGRLRDELAAARGKYKDFDELKNTILELNKENSTLSVDELYHLSRIRTNKGPYIAPDPSSEKPTSSTTKLDGLKHKLVDNDGKPVKKSKSEISDTIDDDEKLDKILEGLGE